MAQTVYFTLSLQNYIVGQAKEDVQTTKSQVALEQSKIEIFTTACQTYNRRLQALYIKKIPRVYFSCRTWNCQMSRLKFFFDGVYCSKQLLNIPVYIYSLLDIAALPGIME